MTKTPIIFLVGIVLLTGGIFLSLRSNDIQKETTESRPTPSGSRLDLSNQNLTEVPQSVFKQAQLTELDLSHNKLHGALPSEVNKLTSLVTLNLSNNEFTGVPAEVGQLRNLEILNLSNNQLTGLPNELGNLTRLKLLDLSGNAYSTQDLETIRARLPASTVIKTN